MSSIDTLTIRLNPATISTDELHALVSLASKVDRADGAIVAEVAPDELDEDDLLTLQHIAVAHELHPEAAVDAAATAA